MNFSPTEAPPGAPEPLSNKLTPWIFKGMQSEYVPEFWPGANVSGLSPYGDNVLVRMDACVNASSGGIILTDERKERMDEASVTGCVYAMGPEAFRGLSDRPQIGQRVYVEKYAGIKAYGRDGAMYRLMTDRCVACSIVGEEQGGEH